MKKLAKVNSKCSNRNYQKEEDIKKIFEDTHISIKRDITNAILNNIDFNEIKTTNFLCSSYAFDWLGAFIHKDVDSIFCYDMDPSVRELSETFFKEEQKLKNIRFYCQDIWTNPKINCSDLTVFMACEHLPPIKYWDGFKFPGYFVFTTTDFSNIKDHNNIVNSLEEFEDQMPDLLDIIFSEEKEYDDYGKQYTIIGKIC
jgi:hypothetical protein